MPRHRPTERTERWWRERDADAYGAAADLDAAHPSWWVLYAPYWGTWDAYWLGPTPVAPLREPSPRALRRAMEGRQRQFAAPPAAHWRSLPLPPGGP